MRRWLIGAALIAALLPGARAWALDPSRAFEKVPAAGRAAWPYAAVKELERAGFSTGSPRGTFGGRPLTRYEFAAAIERMYRSLQPRMLSAGEPGDLRSLLRSFRRLHEEFAPEIADLGHDVAVMQRQLQSMDERLARLQTASAPDDPIQGTLDLAALREVRYGLTRNILDPPLASPTVARPSGRDARSTSGGAGVDIQEPDRLDVLAGTPFEDPSDALGYRAWWTVPLGRYRFGAFYDRPQANWDRYGLLSPSAAGVRMEGIGGSVRGPLSDRLGFNVETARYHPLNADSIRQTIYLQTSLSYSVSRSLSLDLGYTRMQQFGLAGGAFDSRVGSLGIGRSLGSNARLGLMLWFDLGSSGGYGSQRDSNSGAITQISVRF